MQFHQLKMLLIPFQTKPIQGSVEIPGSKSLTNRALLIAAFSEGKTRIKKPLLKADDTETMIKCLKQLGISIETQDDQLV